MAAMSKELRNRPEQRAALEAKNNRAKATADFCRSLKDQFPDGFPEGRGWPRSRDRMLTYIRSAEEVLRFDAEKKIKDLGW